MSPVFTGCVALLALNDHVFKARFPGSLTGKLSDLAGVVVVSIAIAAATHRPTFAVATTSTLFAALKLLHVVASAAAPVLGGVTRTDPTDLIALVGLIPLWCWLQRSTPGAPSGTSGRERRALNAAIATVAVFVCTATSCDEPHGVDRIFAQGDTLWAGYAETAQVADGQSTPQTTVQEWAVSSDGGLTWSETTDQPEPPVAEPTVAEPAEQCGRGGRCWRVVPGERVEVRDGATWTTAYEFSAEQWRRMELRAGHECGRSSARQGAFAALTVTDVSGEDVVLVTMGSQGVLRWSGGEWRRIGVLGRNPVSISGPSWLSRLDGWGVAGLAASAPLLIVIGLLSRGRPWQRFALAALAVLIGAATLVVLGAITDWDYAVRGPVIAGLAVGVFVASLLVALARGRTGADPGDPETRGPESA